MKKTVALIGALDTKGAEYAFVKRCIESRGYGTLIIDVGVLAPPQIEPDISREEVAAAANVSLAELTAKRDRGEAVSAMGSGVAALAARLYAEGRFHAVLALGGSGGTSIASKAARALPWGVPKLIVSTMAGGDVSGYVGASDIVMMPSTVDVAGINRISRQVFSRAVGAVCGMLEEAEPEAEDKPLVAASMFGNTTSCVQAAKAILEEAGYEVLVFHAVGSGGRTMENLIEAGWIAGVLDITTTEWADELVGGVFTAGPTRLEAAARHGVPAVVAPGCLDMVNFHAPETVPKKFQGRRFYQHNPNVTLMRTTPEECHCLGEILAEKLSASVGRVTFLMPSGGLSALGAPGQPFHWPQADRALADSFQARMYPTVNYVEMDVDINDPAFARMAAETLIKHMRETQTKKV